MMDFLPVVGLFFSGFFAGAFLAGFIGLQIRRSK
jgi:hypothetical protein